MSDNRLAAESSPYLLQHKDNPVDWRSWSEEAFEEARRERKPVLLSVGYAACHWCHVMAHESFEDADTAALMNRLFVNIKVDREERPDVDTLYQSALALIGVRGGWPLTMFLTPDREPFWGGTYFPPTSRYGRPGFRDVLYRVAEVFHEDKDGVAHNIAALRSSLERMGRPDTKGALQAGAMDLAAERAAAQVDPVQGGTMGAPKFPQPAFFRLLWASHLATGRPEFAEPVIRTLERMSLGGIYDHVGGGFARYSTDEIWLVPHFEKMLYDNAQLVSLLSEVWLSTRDPLFAARVRETIAWMLRDMRVFADGGSPDAAFASAIDADSAGEEGRYYVWSEAEIDTALGDDAAGFKAAYGVRAEGNWDGHTILNLAAGYAEDREDFLASCRSRLLAIRGQRVPPMRDDKVLAEWNGLTIAALARAATAFDNAHWLDAAKAAYAFIRDRLATPEGGLFRSWRLGRARHAAVLEDYGAMILAALALHETTGDVAPLDDAERWADIVESSFRDPEDAGYFQSGAASGDILVRSKPFIDNALPSGNGLMAEGLARLFHLTGRDVYRERAEAVLSAFAGASVDVFPHMSHLLVAAPLLGNATQIAIVGNAAAPHDGALIRAAFETSFLNRVLIQVSPGRTLPDHHPASGKAVPAGTAAAFVCRGATCGLPITRAEDLRDALRRL